MLIYIATSLSVLSKAAVCSGLAATPSLLNLGILENCNLNNFKKDSTFLCKSIDHPPSDQMTSSPVDTASSTAGLVVTAAVSPPQTRKVLLD